MPNHAVRILTVGDLVGGRQLRAPCSAGLSCNSLYVEFRIPLHVCYLFYFARDEERIRHYLVAQQANGRYALAGLEVSDMANQYTVVL